MHFPEDDEMDEEQAQNAMNSIDREMDRMMQEKHYIQTAVKKRQLDPATAKMVELAQNAGHALGANEALGNRIKFLERRIEVRDKELDRTSDRDEWKARAEAAELKLKRKRR